MITASGHDFELIFQKLTKENDTFWMFEGSQSVAAENLVLTVGETQQSLISQSAALK